MRSVLGAVLLVVACDVNDHAVGLEDAGRARDAGPDARDAPDVTLPDASTALPCGAPHTTASTCAYDSTSLQPNCGDAYYDVALTQRSSASDMTACAWHQGNHVAIGIPATYTHAFDGRA